MSLPMVLMLLAMLCLLAACVADAWRFEIPDSLSIAILALAVVYGFTQPGFGWGWHLLAVALVFAAGLILFARGWMGGGDVKLMTAVAGWTGVAGLPALLTGMAIAGGVLALVLLATRAALRVADLPAERTPGLFRDGAPMPYAIAIAGGTLWWAMRSMPLT